MLIFKDQEQDLVMDVRDVRWHNTGSSAEKIKGARIESTCCTTKRF